MSKVSRTLAVCHLALCFLSIASIRAQTSKPPLAAYADQFQTGKISRDGFDLYFRSAGTGDPVLI